MLGHHFRHDMIKKHVAVFGSLFNDLQIERFDSDDNVWHQVKVPLTYGPRDKLIEAAHKVFGSDQQSVAIVGPRMSFELETIYRDTQRQTSPRHKVRLSNEKHTWNLVPYNFVFNVYVIAKTQTDGNRIIEQILPFFQPSITISIFPINDNDTAVSRDIKVTMNGNPSCEDQYEGDANQRRSIVWTLQFTAQGFLAGPIKEGGIIKKIEMNYIPQDGGVPYAEHVVIRAGLTADGDPTTDPDLSVPYNEIEATDNWAFITEYEDGPIG